jgi:hypothetical protein
MIYDILVKTDSRFLLHKEGDDILIYGSGGFLDSLDLVRLIVSLEEELFKSTGKAVSLSSNRAMSYKNNPYRSLDSLTEFVKECLL